MAFQKASKTPREIALLALAAALLGVACALLSPTPAFATIVSPSATTTAQVQTDGSLHVSEQHCYDFDEEYRSIWWPITGFGDDSKLEGVSVRAARLDENGDASAEWISFLEVPFQTLWRDALSESRGRSNTTPTATGAGSKAGIQTSDDIAVPGYYAFAVDTRTMTIYAFFPSTDDPLVFDIDYTVTDAVRSFDDIAELYWDYAPAREGIRTLDATATVQLPVPEGQTVLPRENVFAWGHGPAGSVEVRADGTISFVVAVIEPGQYGQAHIAFPIDWLTNLTVMQKLAYSGTRLDSARAEEAAWSDTWSHWLANRYLLDIIMLGVCAMLLAVAALLYLRFGRCLSPEGKGIDEKANYVLTALEQADTTLPRVMDINPAEAGRIHRWNRRDASDFVAMLMGLTYTGVITSSAHDDEGAYRDERGIRFHLSTGAKQRIATQLGSDTLKLLFDVCGEGYQSISTEEILAFARKDPEAFSEGMQDWQDSLDADMRRIKAFDATSLRIQRVLLAFAGTLVLCALVFALLADNALLAIAFLASSVAIGVIANYTPRRTQYGERVERLIEVIIDRVCAAERIDPAVAKAILPYAFAHGRAQELFARIGEPSPVEAVWFKPGIVRYKQAPPLAERLSDELETIALRPDQAARA